MWNSIKKIGIDALAHLLPHPSMHLKGEKDNRSYGLSLKLKWVARSILDLLVALPLSIRLLRPISSLFLSQEQKRTLNIYKRAKAAFVKGGGFLHDYGVIVRLAGKRCDVKTIIYQAHGFHLYQGAPKINWLIYSIEKWLAHYADCIITMNAEDNIAAKQFRQINESMVYNVHGVGIDLSEFEKWSSIGIITASD